MLLFIYDWNLYTSCLIRTDLAHFCCQWLWLLFSSKTKFKVGDARKAYAIEHPEPLLHFALCSGSYSDPAVDLYPDSVHYTICPWKMILIANKCFLKFIQN